MLRGEIEVVRWLVIRLLPVQLSNAQHRCERGSRFKRFSVGAQLSRRPAISFSRSSTPLSQVGTLRKSECGCETRHVETFSLKKNQRSRNQLHTFKRHWCTEFSLMCGLFSRLYRAVIVAALIPRTELRAGYVKPRF